MKKFVKYIIAFFIPFLLGIVPLFILPLDKGFSYRFVMGECDNKASWIFNRIFIKKDNIDLAFMGASHISCAIMDEYIGKELNLFSEKEIKVANLGYCRGGRDIQYVMLKDLFQNKKPKLLVLEVMEDEPKKSHPVFPYLAESVDLIGSHVIFNQRYFTNLYKGLVVRFEQFKYKIYGVEYELSENNPDFGYLPSEQIVDPKKLTENKVSWQKRLTRKKAGILRGIELNYSRHYIEKMVTIARDNNCEVVFLYLPESGSGLKMPMLADYYQTLGELLVLPDSILSNKNNWKDATHFNNFGALEVSGYLSSKLACELN